MFGFLFFVDVIDCIFFLFIIKFNHEKNVSYKDLLVYWCISGQFCFTQMKMSPLVNYAKLV